MDNHTKYSRDVLKDAEESLSKIVSQIAQNSVVLDVGCSSGMLGRYLVNQKACIVDGIDIDVSALDVCHPEYRKVMIRNLELDDITHDFIAGSYDYIVVADVIEHLNSSKNLLKQLRLLIKPRGEIIFSVPNITHIASALELLTGRFEYARNGLLDSTHLRFYSYESLIKILADSGIYLWALDTVQRDLTETEFGDNQTKLFPRDWLDAVIASRPDALVYQWVFTTKIYPNLASIDESIRLKKQSVIPNFTTALYWKRTLSDGFNESDKLPGYKRVSALNEFSVEFIFQHPADASVHQIRIDPTSSRKSIWIKRAFVVDPNNYICWYWSGTRATDDVGGGYWSDLAPDQGLILCAENNNPNWYPLVPPNVLSRLKIGSKFVVIMCDDSAIIDEQIESTWYKKKTAYHAESEQKDKVLAEVKQYIDAQEQAISSLHQSISTLHETIFELSKHEKIIHERDAQIQQIFQSTSWRITKPIRFLRRKLESLLHNVPNQNSVTVIQELKAEQSPEKNAIASVDLIETIQNEEEPCDGIQTPAVHLENYVGELLVYSAPLLDAEPLKAKHVKIICFYLPQFHAIPENDAWWGEGFTEWSNVQPAQPQFNGHYQPHIPGELGYYNLLDKATQKRQVELAKLYGIEGFCFYFYWFGGVRLLEEPIINFLNDSTLDLPFCLCWANENWSRRWDGLDQEVLIEQQYSADDDLAFIEHVAQYMRDPRYIRVHGRPLIVVYRPSLLPKPTHTVHRWRNWCRENGIGEIYLAYTQSFDAVAPSVYDFDAAIEFPPNNSAPPNVTNTVKPLSQNFSGNVYDARVFEARSESYTQPKYTLYRGVFPSWDNTARRKENGSIMIHSSPAIYQRWLANAIRNTVKTQAVRDERLVFVNAWNEWAEGAHLEPDQRYGYAYLEATRLALVKTSLDNRSIDLTEMQKVLAFVIHAFYVDVLDEILDYLDAVVLIRIKLYVTTTHENEASVRVTLAARQHDFVLDVVENRGRDILPFMKIMPEVLRAGHNIVVKIHTKKSLHRVDGESWRQDLYDKLLTDEALKIAITTLVQNLDVGILGPEGHLVSMNYFWGWNTKRVIELGARLGVDSDKLIDLHFVAGSMFIARVDAIIPLLNLAINPDEFETETGQVDGTLAHAIERLFAVSAYSIDLKTICHAAPVLNSYEFVE